MIFLSPFRWTDLWFLPQNTREIKQQMWVSSISCWIFHYKCNYGNIWSICVFKILLHWFQSPFSIFCYAFLCAMSYTFAFDLLVLICTSQCTEDNCYQPDVGNRLVHVVFWIPLSGKKLGQGWKHFKGMSSQVCSRYVCPLTDVSLIAINISIVSLSGCLLILFWTCTLSAVRSPTAKRLPSTLLVGSFCWRNSFYTGKTFSSSRICSLSRAPYS